MPTPGPGVEMALGIMVSETYVLESGLPVPEGKRQYLPARPFAQRAAWVSEKGARYPEKAARL